jgi:hypothetical protein
MIHGQGSVNSIENSQPPETGASLSAQVTLTPITCSATAWPWCWLVAGIGTTSGLLADIDCMRPFGFLYGTACAEWGAAPFVTLE